MDVRASSSDRSSTLKERIEELYSNPDAARGSETDQLLEDFRSALNRGDARAAFFETRWKVTAWVKKGLALCLRLGRLAGGGESSRIDLDTLPRRRFSLDDGVRLVDGSCFVRDGSYIGNGCTLMPHTMIQMAASIGPHTSIGNGAGIGVCTQIGARAQIGAGVQIHGAIDPLDQLPAVVGDDVNIGTNSVIGTGVLIGAGAVIFPGCVLLPQSRIYDPFRKQRYGSGPSEPLAVPPGAIVVPGSRSLARGAGADVFLNINVAVIAGYRDDPGLAADLLGRFFDQDATSRTDGDLQG